jgi:hypothetical protein
MAGDIKSKLLASQSLASTGLNSLAASTTRLAGYETNAVDNGAYSGGPCLDYLVSGYFTAAAANHNAGQIDVSVVGSLNDTPNWPDVFDGTASAETVTSANIAASILKPIATILGDSTNDRVYPFGPVGIAQLFGGSVPDQWVVFVSHNIHTTTNAWASSGHLITYTPVLAQYT